MKNSLSGSSSQFFTDSKVMDHIDIAMICLIVLPKNSVILQSFILCSVKPKRTTVDSLYHDFQAQSVVMARAKEVQEKLSPSYPSLIKVMLPSHVTGGFWLVNLRAILLDLKCGLLRRIL